MVNALFQSAIGLHSRGRLAEAEAAYRRVLQLQPRHFDALHMLGLIGLQAGRLDVAVELIGQAVKLNGQQAEAWFNLGNAFAGLGRFTEALRAYDNAIRIRPGYVDALINRANALRDVGRLGDAIAAFRALLRISPNDADLLYNFGTALMTAGQLDEAMTAFTKATQIQPDFAEAFNNLASTLLTLKRPTEALAAAESALRVAADYAEAHNTRGNALADLGRTADALASFDAAIALKPDFADAHSNRGSVLDDLGRCDDALVSYDQSIALQPDIAEAHSNRGNALRHLGRLDEALASYDAAIARDPANAKAHLNKALGTLALGDLQHGFELYEWRKKLRPLPSRARPEWTGQEDLAGKSLFIQWEQGFGDTLHFCRYASLVAARAERVIMAVQTPLVGLLAHSVPNVEIIDGAEITPEFDFHVAMLSLPRAFKTALESIPADIPYLHAPPDRARAFVDRLGPKQRPRIGLVWNSGVRPDQAENAHINARRDVPFALIGRLNLPHIDFFSLQKGEPAESQLSAALAAHWQGENFHTLTDQLTDFADTAGLIAQLDLVISVDTAAAHLAGALGKPLWVLNSFDTCWRWLREREDSPWYPTARLFRQPKMGDWESVIARVQSALRERFPA